MQKVCIDQLREGMTIGQDIYNDHGQILLKRDTALTESYIEALRARTYPAVWIMDGIADDIEQPHIISPRLRARTATHLQSLFLTAQSIGSQSDMKQPAPEFVEEFAAAAKSELSDVYRDAESLVREVTSAKALSGVTTLKSYDNYTFEHSIEVSIAATMLGCRVGMEKHDLQVLAMGCLFHDLGKVAVPVAILNKPGKLTDEEFSIVKSHPEVGFLLAKKALGEGAIIARSVIRQHHERQDGKGYPQGLLGTNRFSRGEKCRFARPIIIPQAEIAAVADVYSALASDRPYRASMKPEQVIGILKEMAGTHLNRELVIRFLSMLPVHPVGGEVVVVSGRLRGYRGIVTRVSSRAMDRPVVRMLFDSQGRQLTPMEIDSAAERDMALASSSYRDLVQAAGV